MKVFLIILVIILGGLYYFTHIWLDEKFMGIIAVEEGIQEFDETGDEVENCTWYTNLPCLFYNRLHSLIDEGYLTTKNTGLLKLETKYKITKEGYEKYKSVIDESIAEMKEEVDEVLKSLDDTVKKIEANEKKEKEKALAKKKEDKKKAEYYPVPQREFIKIVLDFASEYSKHKTEIRKTQTRKKRKDKIKEFIGKRGNVIKSWKGSVRMITTDQEGNVDIIMIKMSEKQLKWVFGGDGYEDLTFSQSKATTGQIKSDDPLIERIADLKTGDLVIFSGKVIARDKNKDYWKEESLLEGGAMQDPEFTVKFSDIVKD